MVKYYLLAYDRNPYAGGPFKAPKLLAKASVESLINARAVAYATIEGKDARYKVKNGMKVGEVVISKWPNGPREGHFEGESVYASPTFRRIVCCVSTDDPTETVYELNRNGRLGEVLDFCD